MQRLDLYYRAEREFRPYVIIIKFQIEQKAALFFKNYFDDFPLTKKNTLRCAVFSGVSVTRKLGYYKADICIMYNSTNF